MCIGTSNFALCCMAYTRCCCTNPKPSSLYTYTVTHFVRIFCDFLTLVLVNLNKASLLEDSACLVLGLATSLFVVSVSDDFIFEVRPNKALDASQHITIGVPVRGRCIGKVNSDTSK